MTVRHRPRALAMLLAAALLWSFGGLLVKIIDWHPLAISGMRSLIAAALIGLVFRRLSFTWSAVQVWAALAYAGTVTLYVVANKLTTAANAILLQYTAPVHVALFGRWVLGEPTDRRDWLTLGAVLGGLVLFFLDDLSPAGMLGNLVALGSGFCFGWLTLLLRKQKEGSTIESVFLGNLLAAAVGLPFMLASPLPDARSWGMLLILGVVQMGLPYVFYALAVRHVAALEAMLVPMIEPVLNPVWVLLLMGERPGLPSVLGGAVVLGAVAWRGIRGGSRLAPAAD